MKLVHFDQVNLLLWKDLSQYPSLMLMMAKIRNHSENLIIFPKLIDKYLIIMSQQQASKLVPINVY